MVNHTYDNDDNWNPETYIGGKETYLTADNFKENNNVKVGGQNSWFPNVLVTPHVEYTQAYPPTQLPLPPTQIDCHPFPTPTPVIQAAPKPLISYNNHYLLIKLNTASALEPHRSSAGAIGLDLYADTPDRVIHIGIGERKLIPLGFSMALPHGHYGRIAPRSGLAWKHGIHVMAGVIDEDYRGEMFALLYNAGQEVFRVQHHDRVAQLIIEKAMKPSVVVVDNLDETERGSGGFGSTGL